MLESTGSHGRGVEQRVPEMRCTVTKQALLTYSSIYKKIYISRKSCAV